ncbi:hypothetical protein Q5424_14170 [Conexibacter sp. JD483]|uniref:hypothetical protein n=1 Tax=unclassified Conexibacter TaxID=2627773 RepID=UPI002716CD25|nr:MULTISPECIES: hypothetical protein [unclassified Conexibacter]MDO8187682.1 hypothetical protein [Conexibacter sp. CPCC 205706]MDO8199867.1 hypothetical protein [Conexibacter sp. CPCC 205762]MDR9370244.1 hypothetical protein [Conexibacter sp. JD483]
MNDGDDQRAEVPRRPRRRVRRLGDIDPTRHGLVLAWWGFTGTFAFLRLLTWLIHIRVAGLGDVSAGGVHLHHYVWGILLLTVVAVFGLVDRDPRTRRWMGLALGVGLALIVDEIALLIELRDVYWQKTGAVSVGAAVLLIGIAGSVLVATRDDDHPGRDDGRHEP